MTELRVALATAQRRLADAGVTSPAADAALLVAHVLGVPRGELSRRIVLGGRLTTEDGERLDALVGRRAHCCGRRRCGGRCR